MKTMHEATENFVEVMNELKTLMLNQFDENTLVHMNSHEFESVKLLFKSLNATNDLLEAYGSTLIEINNQLNVLVSSLEEKES